MKKTFSARPRALFSSAGAAWGAGALIFALIALLLRLAAPNTFWHLCAPLFRSANALSAESRVFFGHFNNAAALTSENEQLQNENSALASENQTLAKQVEQISALFSTSPMQRAQSSGILAGVVARPPESPYDILVLAEGTRAGVTAGMEAFSAGGVPLGVISSLSGDFAALTLFSAPGVVTEGWVGSKDIPISIEGQGGGSLIASVSRAALVAIGDTVFAPGPGMLPIGSVVKIDDDPAASDVVLHIQPAVNLFSIAWVTLRDTGAAFRVGLATSTEP